jgi:polyferredoxin
MTTQTLKPYRPARRIIQVMTLVIIALIPASGLLRIDLTTASFLVMNHEVSWSNFSLVAGLALITATGPILTYLTIGPSWCGWACPQNLLSELANKFTQALLGKRASVDVREELILAPSKNSLWNWARLGL